MILNKYISKVQLIISKVAGVYRLYGIRGLYRKTKHYYIEKKNVAGYQKQLASIYGGPAAGQESTGSSFDTKTAAAAESERCLLYIKESGPYYQSIVDRVRPGKNEPLVSILLIPSDYQPAQSTINGLFEQLYENWELIIVHQPGENFSDLLQVPVVEKVKYCSFEQNKSRAAALNKAVSMARGDYCCLVEEEIIIEQNLLSVLSAILNDNPELEAVHLKLQAAAKTLYFHRAISCGG